MHANSRDYFKNSYDGIIKKNIYDLKIVIDTAASNMTNFLTTFKIVTC